MNLAEDMRCLANKSIDDNLYSMFFDDCIERIICRARCGNYDLKYVGTTRDEKGNRVYASIAVLEKLANDLLGKGFETMVHPDPLRNGNNWLEIKW